MYQSTSTTRLLSCAMVGLVALFGCQFENQEQRQQQSTTAVQRATVEASAKQTADDMNAYAYARKVEFRDRMRTQLNDLNVEIKKLNEDMEKSGAAAREEIKEKLRVLREDETRTETLWRNVEAATEDTWDDVKGAVITAYDGLKGSVNSASEWVVEKTEN